MTLTSVKTCKDLVFPGQASSGQPQHLRETLRVYLIRTQVEETVAEEKQTGLTQCSSMISDVFDALIQYLQSLKVTCLAMSRVLNVSHALLALCPASGADEDFLSRRGQVALH